MAALSCGIPFVAQRVIDGRQPFIRIQIRGNAHAP
jgi:hypothetical protein